MQIEHLNKETTDGTVRNLDALYQLFPSCFTEAQDVITGKMHRAVDWGSDIKDRNRVTKADVLPIFLGNFGALPQLLDQYCTFLPENVIFYQKKYPKI